MIKYLGSKRKLISSIVALTPPGKVLDLFSGTARVSQALKGAGNLVVANDMSNYAQVLATTYCQADKEKHIKDVEKLVAELNQLKGTDGYFTETFCRKSRFFQPFNGEKVDAIREEIARKSLNRELESILLTSLMEAADRVDSTTGVQMAYLKKWASRSYNELQLRVPELVESSPLGKCRAYGFEALELSKRLKGFDTAYLDPPYNQHSYLGNYHIWESLVLWDKPEVYGVACKRIDTREKKSQLNSKVQFKEHFSKIIMSLDVKKILVSFNNEGFISKEDMENLLSERGSVKTHAFDYKRYVGAQIGIHNPEGQKVGTVSHTSNVEYIFEVDVKTSD